MAICFNENDVRPMGRDAAGVRGIMLTGDDFVVGAEKAEEGKTLLTVTVNGYGKRTELSEYLRTGANGEKCAQSRGGKGLKNYNINPKSGNTVMLAFDHGYIMGSTAGLERMDVTIAPLCQYADVLMGTRGAIRSCIPPTVQKPICLRATHA